MAMGLAEIFLIGVGLSADAFAAAVCRGLAMKRLSVKSMLLIALFFGGFQALMPTIGYFLGVRFESLIVSVDHWIAFGLLSFIGGKMIFDVIFHKDGSDDISENSDGIRLSELICLAAATSVDALAVGIGFAFLGTDILPAAAVIGITTFTLSAIGVFAGHRFGGKFRRQAYIAGGAILILIG
ncbi:MAG: manganese efflux pump MntP family protein, partial [Oscillospiraceae bacterium]